MPIFNYGAVYGDMVGDIVFVYFSMFFLILFLINQLEGVKNYQHLSEDLELIKQSKKNS